MHIRTPFTDADLGVVAVLVTLVGMTACAHADDQPKPHLEAAPTALKVLWKAPDVGQVVSVSADGQALVTVKNENESAHVILWDLRDGKRVRTHKLPYKVRDTHLDSLVAVSPDARYFVTEERPTAKRNGGNIMLAVDLQTGKELRHDWSGRAAAQRLFVNSAGVISRIHRYSDKHTIDFKSGTVVDHTPEIKAIDAKFVVRGLYDYRFATPDGKYEGYWGSMKDHGVVRVINLATKKEVLTVAGFWGNAPVLSPDGKTLVIGTTTEKGAPGRLDGRSICETGHIELWSMTDLKRNAAIPWKQIDCIHNGFDLRFSPDGRLVALWCGNVSVDRMDSVVQVWEVSGKHLGNVEAKPLVRRADFSPDGKMLLVFGDDAMHVLDAATLRPLWKSVEQRAFAPLLFSSDGRQLIRTPLHGVEWRDLATGKVKSTLPTNTFTPDIAPIKGSRYLVFRDFRRADGKPFKPAERDIEDEERVKLIRFSRIVDRDTGREILRVDHAGFISQFQVSADGKSIIEISVRDNLSRDLTCWQLPAP